MFERLFGVQYSKFRLGQLLFLTAVTFGLFAGDVIRIILAVFALFCLGHENFKFNWCREQKITGIILAVFCAWMIIIPVVFGENPLPVRFRDAVRPFELTLWIGATLLFAKDEFFVRNFKNMSIVACFIYAIIALVWCIKTKLLFNWDSWPILRAAYSVSSLIAGLSGWLIYNITIAKSNLKKVFYFVDLLLVIPLVILPRYTTFWGAFSLSIFIVFFLLLFKDKRGLVKLLVYIVIASCVVCCVIYCVAQKNLYLQDVLNHEICQLTAWRGENFNMEQFTNHRDKVWKDALVAIKQKPLLGHGREVFVKYCHLQYIHAHNSWLQAAFEGGIPLAILFTTAVFMIFLLAFWSFNRARSLLPLPFMTIVVLTQFLIAGTVENLYLTNRSMLVFYWSIFISMVALYNNNSNRNNRN